MDGDYTVEERMMLEVSFYQNGKKQTYQVLNDAIVARGSLSRILEPFRISMKPFANIELTV